MIGASALLWPALGCGGSELTTVSGRAVRVDGTPVAAARVIVRSDETGKSAQGMTNNNGEFSLGTDEPGGGIPAGNYIAVIVEGSGAIDAPVVQTIAAKYGDPTRSGLTFTVTQGKSVLLDWKLDPP